MKIAVINGSPKGAYSITLQTVNYLMRKYLLPKEGNFYKANLHSHSTLSDGSRTPEQLKEAYKAQGYSVFAYTDHNCMVDHSDLDDESFLTLKGFEGDVTETKEQMKHKRQKCCHMCFIAIDPDTKYQVLFNRVKHAKYIENASFDENEPDYVAHYSAEGVSDMMKRGRDAGFFVTYNHPVWSLETAEEYLHYDGMHAMEICNYLSYSDGMDEYNPYVYDQMLREGKRIFCIGSDDNHNNHADTFGDSFGAFTMIKAEKLEYRAITAAMLRGDMYASQKPLIEELWYEDGKVHIKCTPARKIALTCGTRHIRVAHARDRGPLTEATFDVDPNCVYFRLTVTDFEGYPANTRAYFMDELVD